MDRVGALAEDLVDLQRSLAAVETRLGAVCAELRELSVDDVGPADAATALGDAVVRLERRLAAVTQESAEGTVAVRRHVAGAAS